MYIKNENYEDHLTKAFQAWENIRFRWIESKEFVCILFFFFEMMTGRKLCRFGNWRVSLATTDLDQSNVFELFWLRFSMEYGPRTHESWHPISHNCNLNRNNQAGCWVKNDGSPRSIVWTSRKAKWPSSLCCVSIQTDRQQSLTFNVCCVYLL